MLRGEIEKRRDYLSRTFYEIIKFITPRFLEKTGGFVHSRKGRDEGA